MIRRLLLLALLCAPAVAKSQTRPASFVDVATLIPDLVADLRYAASDNFIGTPIAGYEQPVCLLAREAALALAEVQADLKPRGLGLKVFDCYRPARAVAHFLRWARDPSDQRNKTQYYPDVDKRDLFRLGYLAARSGHSRGSTVDLTLVTLADKRELDMGTPYDFLSPRSALSSTDVSAQARANRLLLAEAMRRRGFRGYSKEWWHFTLNREPFPDSYFDFPVR
ncbi:MAG: M15 family metallopeptidase [Pseudorhodoplanes sp.]|nr:M15 family metallopeptidase [Pseudorhodoplanes sp.]